MEYYKRGDAAKSKQIKAAFEKLGYKTNVYCFNSERTLYFTFDGAIETATYETYKSIIENHPDYKELELPVEPKFKVGDWLWHNTLGVHPILVKDYSEQQGYKVEGLGLAYYLQKGVVENECRLWTIADAKDGDVLATGNIICIFKKLDKDGYIISPCIYTVKGGLEVIYDENDSIGSCGFKPATKEDRELLFRKMKEAGYEWDADKKEVCKFIEPKFKVGDSLQSGCMYTMVRRIDTENQRYVCQFDNVIPFKEQNLWSLVPNPKPHYDIANFHAGMPVLVRILDEHKWCYLLFSHCYKHQGILHFHAGGAGWLQCIPFNKDTEHLLGTTDMCDEQYINW